MPSGKRVGTGWRKGCKVARNQTEPIFQQGPVTNKPGNLQSRQEDILSRQYQMSALVQSITLEKTDPECVSGLPEQMLVTHSPRARDKQAGSKQGCEAAVGSCLGCLPYSLSSLSLGQKHELSQGTPERLSF